MRISKPPGERRDELVAAARALFDERGVEKTRVSDIVRRVGVAQGVFYYYFPSKQAMVQQVVQQVTNEFSAAADTIIMDDIADFGEKLARFIELFLDLVDQFLGDDEPNILPLFSGADGAPKGPAAEAAACLSQKLEQLIAIAEQRGEVPAAYPRQTAQVLLLGFAGLARRQMPERPVIYNVAQQALGLPEGALTRHLP